MLCLEFNVFDKKYPIDLRADYRAEKASSGSTTSVNFKPYSEMIEIY